jgi:hypothetical protein
MWECGGDERMWRAKDEREIVCMWRGICRAKGVWDRKEGCRVDGCLGRAELVSRRAVCVDLCGFVENLSIESCEGGFLPRLRQKPSSLFILLQ